MPALPSFSRRRFLGTAGALGAAAAFGVPTAAGAAQNHVVPIDWGSLGSYPGTDAAGERVTAILAGSSRYLIGPWYAGMYTRYLPDGYIDLRGTDERAIRLPAMAAVAATTALTTGTYDPRTLSAANATIRTRNLIRTLGARHRANNADTATRWGNGWQTALWAYYTALAGWLFWEKLDTTERDHLAAMLAWEADRLTTGNGVHLIGTGGDQLYMTRRDGTVVTPGDSKAEEDNWSAAALSLAAVMMPNHPNAARWTRRNIELLLAAAACPQDLTSDETINGIRLSTWLQGTNIADDGTLQNHARLHPLYMVAFDQSLYQGFVFALANRPRRGPRCTTSTARTPPWWTNPSHCPAAARPRSTARTRRRSTTRRETTGARTSPSTSATSTYWSPSRPRTPASTHRRRSGNASTTRPN